MSIFEELPVIMGVNYFLLFAALFVCFTGAYFRRISCIVMSAFSAGFCTLGTLRILMLYQLISVDIYVGKYMMIMLIGIAVVLVAAGILVLMGKTHLVAYLNTVLIVFPLGIIVLMALSIRPSLVHLFAILCIGIVVGAVFPKEETTGLTFSSALVGAAAAVITGVALNCGASALESARAAVYGGITQTGIIVPFVVLWIAGMLVQRMETGNVRYESSVLPAYDGRYSLRDFMWKHWLVCIITLGVFLADQILLAVAGRSLGGMITLAAAGRSPCGIITLSVYVEQAAKGVFVGGLIFFVWNFGPAAGFIYQLFYLVWIPFELIFHTAGRLSGATGTVAMDIAQYLVFWLVTALLKKAVGLRREGTVLSVVLAVLYFPWAAGFLAEPEAALPAFSASVEKLVLWAGAVAGIIVLSRFCDPETAGTGGHRYSYKKNEPRYCRVCGERRKINYVFCGNCGTKYRGWTSGKQEP